MSDLISRSGLLKEIEKYKFGAISNDAEREYIKKTILDFIICQPTAYDIDKVVEELEELKAYAVYEDINADTKWLDKAIEIVKHGVVADDVCGSIADKIKVTSLEVIVTGKREKPYYEIKYKEVGEIDYKIGYSSYDLNNVFAWRDEFFEIVNHK